MSPLLAPLDTLPHLGGSTLKRFHRLGLFTIFDLLTYPPRTYESRSSPKPIRDLIPGQSASIIATIVDVQIVYKRSKILNVTIDDETGIVVLRFFHFYPSQIKNFTIGKTLYCFGEIRQFGRYLEISHPEYSFIEIETDDNVDNSTQVLAIYPLSEGLTQKRLRTFMDAALQTLSVIANDTELIPAEIMLQHQLLPYQDAVTSLHHPTENDLPLLLKGTHPAQIRLSFEELLAYRLAIIDSRQVTQHNAPQLFRPKEIWTKMMKNLPFQPTGDQLKALQEISADLTQKTPMQRLLQGDVGTGKTWVAFAAALIVLGNGYQVAFMAPTEILAEQLYSNAVKILESLGFQPELLVGKLTAKKKQTLHSRIQDGSCSLVIGTHALIQEDLEFKNLGLVIIDEQHRFGVAQRLALCKKNVADKTPHQLMMTATPIPRTLAMTLYSELKVSSIYERPQNRKLIKTALVSHQKRDDVIRRLHQACKENEQAYWICPLIDESDLLNAEAAEVTFKRLSRELPSLNIGLIHGRMPHDAKTKTMTAFKQGELHILVATTVVEVGVDVQNASIIIIENPERMGLSQLHQLRGRVGRGEKKSACILLYQGPLSNVAIERLIALRDHQDGFYLAEKDLELRGPGEFMGTRQKGAFNFRFASLIRDQPLLSKIHDVANRMQDTYPERSAALIHRWFGQKREFVKA